ncbi:MAG: dockerin type I domain-containing protein [candidate division Zixibacteria bacterium]|nr:dockerin type I domain-containing protein [candidate division Zixibacteria bacterium]
MISRHAITVVILAVLLLAMTAVATATKHIVNVGNFAFTPKKTQVAPGDTVRWVWSSGLHTTTSDPSSSKSWGSPTLSGVGQFFDVIFALADGPGPFPYHCEVYPLTMMDTIFVNVPATVHFIKVSDFAFTPAKTPVNPGDTVIWLWESGIHTTTSDPSSFKSWNSPSLSSAGQSFQLVFGLADGPGPFAYHCEVHPLTMLDTIFINYPTTVHHIAVGDFAFTPAKTHVNPGDAVIWAWANGLHNTTSDPSSPKSWTSSNFAAAGDNFQLTFSAGDGPGPFPYHCDFHPLDMLDTIYVNSSPTCTACGDANSDGGIDISDAVFLISYIFSGGVAPGFCNYVTGKGDANGDGEVDISDAVYLISYIFSGGSAPHCQ